MKARQSLSRLSGGEVWDIARHVWETEGAAVRRLARVVDPAALERCVRLLARCRGKIFTTGCGTSMAAARKIAHSLCCVERPAAFLAPGDAVHGGLGAVQRGDVVVAISKGGGTREIVDLLGAIRAKGATLIGVTENAGSVLGRRSNVVLKVAVAREPDPFNMLATASTMAVIAVFDAVCIALMRLTRYTRRQFALIHPAGAVGLRLAKTAPRASPPPPPRHRARPARKPRVAR
ncbi:MAG: SIS domain-containing protein [Verrucomicrobia bacterium]|nr:SIS domain-containing protein [Verrucomicrobiota bacterium]